MSVRFCAALVALILASSMSAADPVNLASFVALPRPVPMLEVRYGAAPSQATDVFLPSGPGPHPVTVLIHGGCWRDIKGAGRATPPSRAGADTPRHRCVEHRLPAC
jgi:acetyl esterase/lipase